MERYCQNPLCENEATKMARVSVDTPSDQRRALCAVCEEVYAWGVQHGRMAVAPQTIWVLQVTDAGTVVHARAFKNRRKALRDLLAYLRTHERYTGPQDLSSICDWMAECNERLGVDIFVASLDVS